MTGEMAARRVLFLGDSLVAGVGDPAGGGWVARVVSACFDHGTPVSAYNLGVRRETSIEVAARWRAEAAPRLALTDDSHTSAAGDARLVVSFGANDTALEHGRVRVPAERSRRALATLLDEASGLGLAQFVVGPAPVDDPAHNDRISDLTDSFAEVCGESGTPFIRTVGPLLESPVWMSEVTAGDGAHPAADGYQALAELLMDSGLLAWLSKPVARARGT